MMKPIGDRALIRLDVKEEKKGLIFIPDSHETEQLSGTVMSKGKGKYADLIEVDDHVLIAKMFRASVDNAQLCTSAFDCDENGDRTKNGEYLMLDAENILAILD